MVDWTQMTQFRGITLNGCKVLGWSRTPSALTIRLIARLQPGAEGFEQPGPGEDACYRWATLVFPDVERVMGLRHVLEVPEMHGPLGETYYGYIEELHEAAPGHYELNGPMGELTVRGGAPRLEVDGAESAA